MTPPPPHRALMLLHRSVDRALAPLLEPMGFVHATESYVTASHDDFRELAASHGDPQAVLVGFGDAANASGALIAEPSLASAVLARIWRSDRNAGAPLTHVEGEILRQFLARTVDAWHGAWSDEGARMLPTFSMAGSLSMLSPQMPDGRWHVARTVVRHKADDAPAGVLLFCYPEQLAPRLAEEAAATSWRTRIERGLTDREHTRLRAQLSGPLRDVVITAPVCIRQHVTIGMLNALERGDVLAFDTDPTGDIAFHVLNREVTGQLAAHGDQLALALSGPALDGALPEPLHTAGVDNDSGFGAPPGDSWDLVAS